MMTLLSPALRYICITLALSGASQAQNTAQVAQPPALYADADWILGEKLIQEHQCATCHQSRVGGDGSAIYRPGERIGTLGALRGMVESCNLELNLALFPDEVNSIAAVLNRDYYQFK